MKALMVYPVMVIVFLGLSMELVDIAESTSEKTVAFADDMYYAVDCAVRGIDIAVCSPNLMDHDFEPEINRTVKANKEIMQRILDNIGEENIAGLVELNNTIIIELVDG
ncbi:hypothetical protein JXB31_05200 [Candidatus Woesearchaeota archaeon]|nr:hypothetical protein [Candidatus Woesearchaeota archaeon]